MRILIVLVVGLSAAPVDVATGRIAGNVRDGASGLPVAGAVVEARRVTTNELFTSPATDRLGSYRIGDVPAGIYAMSIVYEDELFPVPDLFDVRIPTSYLLEACFELGGKAGTASIAPTCSSGLYAEAQVVSLGPHRYVRRVPPTATHPEIAIEHDRVGCISSGRYPILRASIVPNELVAIGRAFFRAEPHPDFYYVDMTSARNGFQAVLPRPAPETSEIVYYFEAIDTNATAARTTAWSVAVGDCEEDPSALYFQGDDPGIVVGATRAGAPLTPPGFLPAGVESFIAPSGATTAAIGSGGELGGLGIDLIVVAAAGSTAFIVLRSTTEEEASAIR